MTLIATIFALVFLTELISWIGKSVLLELVSPASPIGPASRSMLWIPGIRFVPAAVLLLKGRAAEEAEE